jgi:hypothetical protein
MDDDVFSVNLDGRLFRVMEDGSLSVGRLISSEELRLVEEGKLTICYKRNGPVNPEVIIQSDCYIHICDKKGSFPDRKTYSLPKVCETCSEYFKNYKGKDEFL